MTPAEALSEARARGVVLTVEAGKLRYEGPAGSMTPALREALAQHKDDLLAILAPGDPAAAYRVWLVTYPTGRRVETHFSPPVARDKALATYTEALGAVPYEPPVSPPEAPMSPEEERAIPDWLASIGETDEGSIREVLDRCRRDGEARDYYLGRAAGAEPRARSWLITRPDGSKTQVNCTLEVPRSRVLEVFPQALDAAPLP